MRNRASMPNRVWLKILLFSVLFHLLLLIVFWPALRELFRDPDVPPGMQFDITVERSSVPAPAEPEPEKEEAIPEEEPAAEEEPTSEEQPEPEPEPEPEEEMHLPRDTDETVDLDGTDTEAPEQEAPLMESGDSDEASDAPAGQAELRDRRPSGAETPEEVSQEDTGTGEAASAPAEEMERVETEGPEGADAPDADSASMSLGGDAPSPEDSGAPSIPDDAVGSNGGIQALDDEEMDTIRGESPVSEIEERRIRMANEYLARMKRQIVAAWDQPDSAEARHKGEIRFSVDSGGYLRTSRVHLPSGNKALDESALSAVRSVERYRVPDSPSIVRQYYQSLRFTYSGASLNNDQ